MSHASPDKFELVFPKLPTSNNMNDNKLLTLNLFDTIIPGVSFGLNENHWQNYRMSHIVSNIEFSPLNASFVIDEDFRNWKLLLEWLLYINNNRNIATKKKSEYEVDASLLIYDNFNTNILTLKYNGMFLYELGEVTLSYRDSEQYLMGTCTFGFDSFEINN